MRLCEFCGTSIEHRRREAKTCGARCYDAVRSGHQPGDRIRPRHGETHAGTGSAEFRIWNQMRGRCYTVTHGRYKDYGGRGITVCEHWRYSVSNFISDMGRRPSPDHQLERKDNDGPYSPENCVWATRKEQGRNKRNNVLLTLAGKTQCLSAWAEETGIPYATLKRRNKVLGWTDEESLTTAVRPMRPRKISNGEVSIV